MKVIIDVDSGIDDIYALTVALLKNDLDILAITVTCGNTSADNGVINTKLALDKLFPNRQHPQIYIGANEPLTSHPDFYPFFDIDGLGGTHQTIFKEEVENIKETFLKDVKSINAPHAANKIIELVNKYPNEITIIALGPLTNIALALRMSHDPINFSKNIKKLVIMGGNEPKNFSFEPFVDRVLNYPEFNFKYDAIAAKIVLDNYLCPITIYTYDCCLRAFDIETDELIKEFNNYIHDCKKCHFLERIGIPHRLSCIIPRVFYSCDLVTMIGIFYSNECKAVYKKLHNYTIQANSSKLDGLIVERTEDSNNLINENIELCITMDSTDTFNIFKSYLVKLRKSDEKN